jgi:homoserine kinase
MGPGFDCFGIALNLYNVVSACETESGLEILSPEFKVCRNEERNHQNLVYRAMREVFNKAEYEPTGLKIVHGKSEIPRTRGLGSSAACAVAGVLLANEIAGHPFSRRELLNLAVKVEGHSDNATSAMYGGFGASFIKNGVTYFETIPVMEGLMFVLFVPHFTVSTKKSRKSLPQLIPIDDAVNNISHAAMMGMAFATGNFKGLPLLFSDAIHEKHRKDSIPNADFLIKASSKFGAYGTYVSGSGPTLAAVVSEKRLPHYLKLMRNFVEENHIKCDIIPAHVDNRGALIDKKEK